MWTSTARLSVLLLAIAAPAGAQSDRPLSAIDWLSQSVAPQRAPATAEPPVAEGAEANSVEVTPLTATPTGDAAGILPASITGLPRDLWTASSEEQLIRLINEQGPEAPPALVSLLLTLLLAEAEPPKDGAGGERFLLARVDKLLQMGAVEQAVALMDQAGVNRPEMFRRWFDASLLMGEENAACAAMRANEQVAPTLSARIFCLARGGDWNAAALTLETGSALDALPEPQRALLSRFLEEDMDTGEPYAIPEPLTPLSFSMLEAIGEPLPTQMLPLAFAHTDLRPPSGWKARIQAAERLARAGVLPGDQLLAIYTEGKPAASGGVWDRVRAMQALDEALRARDGNRIAATLADGWAAMQEIHAEVAFASYAAPLLEDAPLTGPADALAFRIGLLSELADKFAHARDPATEEEEILVAVARGKTDAIEASGALEGAVLAGFAKDAPLKEQFDMLLRQGRPGAAILRAILLVQDEGESDLDDITASLRLLRKVGLDNVARATALQLLLLHGRN